MNVIDEQAFMGLPLPVREWVTLLLKSPEFTSFAVAQAAAFFDKANVDELPIQELTPTQCAAFWGRLTDLAAEYAFVQKTVNQY